MSIYSIYFTNQKGNQQQHRDSVYSENANSPIRAVNSAQKDRESIYNSQILQKALAESFKQTTLLRSNSPTFKLTDTINQSNHEIPQYRSSIKKGIYSGIDSFNNPQRNVHVSHNSSNDQLLMFREGKRLKKYLPKQKEISQEKDWKSCIKVYKALGKEPELAYKRLRKSVEGRNVGSDPILSPNSKEVKRIRVPCPIKFEEKNSMESIKTFKHANSSAGFLDSQKKWKDTGSPQKSFRKEAQTLKSEIKSLLKYQECPQFSKSEYKGSEDIKKSKRYSIKVDYPRPTSAFAF